MPTDSCGIEAIANHRERKGAIAETGSAPELSRFNYGCA
jgi:hypothetical protein